MRILYIFVASLMASLASAQVVQLADESKQSLSSQELKLAQDLLQNVETLLPQKMKTLLADQKVRLAFSDIKGDIAGHYTRANNTVTIERRLLNAVLKDLPLQEALKLKSKAADQAEGDKQTSHKDTRSFVLATMIHEVSHAYDLINVRSEELRALDLQCAKDRLALRRSGAKHVKNTEQIPESCRLAAEQTTLVSSNILFQEAVGFWRTSFLGNADREQMNFFRSRSPDYYEWTNKREAFAVNMEYFLLDSEFQCRRPETYRVLSNLLNHVPFSKKNCETENFVMVSPDLSTGLAGPQIGGLDPERVYAIHYLYAGPNDQMMSKWGHAMFRIVTCAPQRQLGPDCEKDIGRHLVISYRASVNDLQLDTWKGIAGDYPSTMFILPLSRVITEYTKTELRELTSLPLKLSRDEIKNFIRRTAEQHWTYRGRYKFLSNNCADESIQLLKLALNNGQRNDFQSLQLTRPDQFYSYLMRSGLGDGSGLLDKKSAVQRGLYFPSKKEQYELAIRKLQDFGLLNSAMTLDAYLSLSADKRSEVIAAAIGNSDKSIREKEVAMLMILEDLILLKIKMNLGKNVGSELVRIAAEAEARADRGGAPENKDEITKEDIGIIKMLLGLFSSPANLLTKGTRYGMPSKAEIEAIPKNDLFREENMKRIAAIQDKINKQTDKINKGQPQTIESEKCGENLKRLRESFRNDSGLKIPGVTGE